jgi:phosphatidylinositol glycan class T
MGVPASVALLTGWVRSGFDVGPAVVSWRSERGDSGRVVTSGAVVHLPTPDFSMPFNVAALTATVHALLFGVVFNALRRGYSVYNTA